MIPNGLSYKHLFCLITKPITIPKAIFHFNFSFSLLLRRVGNLTSYAEREYMCKRSIMRSQCVDFNDFAMLVDVGEFKAIDGFRAPYPNTYKTLGIAIGLDVARLAA
jgi:hypothetical protein